MGQLTKFVTSALIRCLVSPVSVDLSVLPDRELPKIKKMLEPDCLPPASQLWKEIVTVHHQGDLNTAGVSISDCVNDRGQEGSGKEDRNYSVVGIIAHLSCHSWRSECARWTSPWVMFGMFLPYLHVMGFKKHRHLSLPCLGLDKSWLKGLSQ